MLNVNTSAAEKRRRLRADLATGRLLAYPGAFIWVCRTSASPP
jgi:hypothetical protein